MSHLKHSRRDPRSNRKATGLQPHGTRAAHRVAESMVHLSCAFAGHSLSQCGPRPLAATAREVSWIRPTLPS